MRGAPYRNYPVGPSTRLPDALLSVQSVEVSILQALCPKRFTLEILTVGLSTKPVRWRKKNKKNRGGKNSSWVGEKNTLLKKLLSALACAFFKSVFFCGLILVVICNPEFFYKLPFSSFN